MTASTSILTHGDLDGLISGIFLLTALGPDTPFRIANGDTLARELEHLGMDAPSAVYIADIPLVAARKTTVESVVADLHARASTLHLYDHHLGWDAAGLKPHFATYIVDTRRTTAAVLVWQYLLQRDPATRRWLTVLSQKDNADDPATRGDFQLLLALMQPCHWHLTAHVLPALARGALTEADREPMMIWYQTVYEPMVAAVIENVDITLTGQGRRIAWVDLRGHQEYINVTRAIIERYGVDLVATIIPKGILLGGPGIDRGIDLSPLHGTHEYQELRFTIAGHCSPVRISPSTRQFTGEFIQTVYAFVQEKL
ncbi:MAG: hypothetical protein ACYDCO_20740 [Armatimonadota bacterium]